MATASSAPASTSMVTLKYSGAVISALIAINSLITVLGDLFGLWTDKYGATSESNYVGTVTLAVTAVLFSVLAFLLYRRVTKDVAAQPEYVNKPVYHFITNGFFGVTAAYLIVLTAQLVSVLISSLLLIGTNADIGALYLNQFLPTFVAAGMVAFVGFAAYKIMKGKNLSTLMTIVLMSLAGALMIAVLITVPIKAHSGTTSSTNPTDTYNLTPEEYFYQNLLRN